MLIGGLAMVNYLITDAQWFWDCYLQNWANLDVLNSSFVYVCGVVDYTFVLAFAHSLLHIQMYLRMFDLCLGLIFRHQSKPWCKYWPFTIPFTYISKHMQYYSIRNTYEKQVVIFLDGLHLFPEQSSTFIYFFRTE